MVRGEQHGPLGDGLGDEEPVERVAVDVGQVLDRGRVWIADDFDELPEDLQRAFEGEE